MAKKKSRDALLVENRFLRSTRFGAGIFPLLATLIRSLVVVAVMYLVYLTATVLAGKTTMADVGVRVLGRIEVSEALACLFGAGGVGYGLAERKLRQSKVKHLHPRIKELESTRDPGRSTSALTQTGDTNPEDGT